MRQMLKAHVRGQGRRFDAPYLKSAHGGAGASAVCSTTIVVGLLLPIGSSGHLAREGVVGSMSPKNQTSFSKTRSPSGSRTVLGFD